MALRRNGSPTIILNPWNTVRDVMHGRQGCAYLGERGDLLAVGGLDIVDGYTTIGTTGELVGHLRNLETKKGRGI